MTTPMIEHRASSGPSPRPLVEYPGERSFEVVVGPLDEDPPEFAERVVEMRLYWK